MPGPLKLDGIVLRSIRYAEADRVLHLYTPERGRVSAIAKGVRRPRSRFGGRLEPFFRIRLLLHEGRGDLLTITGAETIAAHARLREDAGALEGATRANALAFRLKLLLAAGFAPQLAGCASCGEQEHLVGFSGAAGGVVCAACEASAFPLAEEAHAFMVAALGRSLADAPDAPPRALAQAERAILD